MPFHFALMAALPMEVRPFLRQVGARPRKSLGLPAWEFQAGEGRGVLGLAGLGAAAAHRGASRLLDHCSPSTFLCLGFGGALNPGLAPGSVVLGESVWEFRPDTGSLMAVPVPAPPRPLPELAGCLSRAGLPALTGSIVTTPQIIHKGRQGAPLQGLPCPVLDLETAPAATAAAACQVAFLGLRAVTDAAGEEIPDFLIQAAAQASPPGLAAALGWVAGDPRRLAALLWLWRRGRRAARCLARALEVLLPIL